MQELFSKKLGNTSIEVKWCHVIVSHIVTVFGYLWSNRQTGQLLVRAAALFALFRASIASLLGYGLTFHVQTRRVSDKRRSSIEKNLANGIGTFQREANILYFRTSQSDPSRASPVAKRLDYIDRQAQLKD